MGFARGVVRLRFGEFVLDTEARQLTCRGRALHVTPKAFDVLALLLERRPRVLAKPEIQARVWPATFVSEANLAALVHEIRAALDDDAHEPRFVRTVHGIGYAFGGEATPEAEPARQAPPAATEYRVIWRRREIALALGDNVLGRTHAAAVWVEHESVSRRHAVVHVAETGATLEDAGSKNGTFVGDRRVHAPMPLADRDVIRLGRARLVFRVFEGEASTCSASDSQGLER